MADEQYGDTALGSNAEWQLRSDAQGKLSVSHDKDESDMRFDQVMLATRHLYPSPAGDEIAWPEGWGPDERGRGVRIDGKPDFPD